MFKRIKWLVLVLLMLPISALAIEAKSGDIVVLEADQVVEGNYYVAGNVVEIYGTVNGDIFAAGETITVDSANINGDIFAAGSNVTVNGDINGSLRLAGERLEVFGDVDGNIMAAGQSLKLNQDANLDGHLTFWGQLLSVAGTVNGRVDGAMEGVRISGTVDKDLDVYLSANDSGAIQIGDNAVVGGTIYYKALKEVNFNPNAEIGGVSFNKVVKESAPAFGAAVLFGLIVKFFGMLIVGMIWLHLWPKFFSNAYSTVAKKPAKTFLHGLLLLVVTPIACILAAITVIGLPLAGVMIAAWLIFMYLATVVAAWLIGQFVKNRFFAKRKWHNLVILAIGVALFIIIKHIPFFGWIFIMVIYMMAWGTFVGLFKKEKK